MQVVDERGRLIRKKKEIETRRFRSCRRGSLRVHRALAFHSQELTLTCFLRLFYVVGLVVASRDIMSKVLLHTIHSSCCAGERNNLDR